MEANALFGCVKEKSQTESLSAQSINILMFRSLLGKPFKVQNK